MNMQIIENKDESFKGHKILDVTINNVYMGFISNETTEGTYRYVSIASSKRERVKTIGAAINHAYEDYCM
jgi:hypothetical protein